MSMVNPSVDLFWCKDYFCYNRLFHKNKTNIWHDEKSLLATHGYFETRMFYLKLTNIMMASWAITPFIPGWNLSPPSENSLLAKQLTRYAPPTWPCPEVIFLFNRLICIKPVRSLRKSFKMVPCVFLHKTCVVWEPCCFYYSTYQGGIRESWESPRDKDTKFQHRVRPWGDCCGMAVIMVRCVLEKKERTVCGWKGLRWPKLLQ